MEKEKRESLKTLELRTLERDRNDILYEYMSAQIDIISSVIGFVVVGCCGFYFGKLPGMMFGLALFLLLHVFNIVYHGWKAARETDEYIDLSKDIRELEAEIDILEEEVIR